MFSVGLSFSDTVAAEESVYGLQGVFMVRVTDYSQGTGGEGGTTGTVCHSPSPVPSQLVAVEI